MAYADQIITDSEYFYCPCVPLTESPIVLNLDFESLRRHDLMERYSEENLREGARYYSRLSVENFIENESKYFEGPSSVNWVKNGF